MTDETRNDQIAGAGFGEVAREAALIAIFYGPRVENKSCEEPIWKLYERLHREFEGPLPDKEHTAWRSDASKNEAGYVTIGHLFEPPGRAALDTSAVQLALSVADGDGDASKDWQEMHRHLGGKLNTRELKDIWGHSLIYQAVLKGNTDPDGALAKGLPLIRQLGSDRGLYMLEKAEVSGGWMWLLDIPVSIPNQRDEEDRSTAGTVYCALSGPEGEEALLNMFYGHGAELLTPDLIAHKGYYQMRQYRDEKARIEVRYHVSLAKLRRITEKLREELLGADQVTEEGLKEETIDPYYQLLNVISSLKELHFGILRQLENYDRQRKRLGRNNIIEYHRDHLDTAVRELSLMIEPLEYELETVDKAISAAQLQIGKDQEEQQRQSEERQQTRHLEAMEQLTGVEAKLRHATVWLAAVTLVLVTITIIEVVLTIYEYWR